MSQDADTAIVLRPPSASHPDSRDMEMVERKGRGHPDSICDALSEAFTISLTRAYYERCGAVLHHNVDKVLLAAGASTPRFGGGEVTAPFEIYLAGRATHEIDGLTVPVADIAEQSSRGWLRANLHALDTERHVRIHSLVRPGSAALSALVTAARERRVLANDTSFAVGYAPASRLETIVRDVEQTLTAPSTVRSHPMIGEDVKVMGVRRGDRIDITIACAIVDRYVRGLPDYIDATRRVQGLAEHAAHRHSEHVHVTVNTADDLEAGRMYLAVTGTSAEAGDDGQTGRGNRVGGLITPYRPMTLEAAAGKNVVAHVGKSYSIVAHQMAHQLVETCPEIAEATCLLVSRIGRPVDSPQAVELQVRTHGDIPLERVRERATVIARDCLQRISVLSQLLIERARIEAPATWPGVDLF